MKSVYDRIYTDAFVDFFTQQRKEKNWTRTYVAKMVNVNLNTFLCYENGTRDCPLSVFKKLCFLYSLDFYDTFKKLDQECEKRIRENAKVSE